MLENLDFQISDLVNAGEYLDDFLCTATVPAQADVIGFQQFRGN